MASPEEAIAAHDAVRSWVRAWTVPGLERSGELPEVWGASVTIRLDGAVVARGSWIADDAPTAEAVWRAAGEAVRVGRAALPARNDALDDERFAAMGSRATVSLELIGTPVPIPDDELGLPYAGCSPGAQALVARVDGVTRVVGVDAQLTRGSDPATELAAMATSITGAGETALRPIAELTADGYVFSRAPVTHVAMPFADATPVFLARGAGVVPAGAIRSGMLRETADLIAAHLRSRLWPGVEQYGIGGDLNAATGAVEGVSAPPFDQAMTAMALLSHAAMRSADAAESGKAALEVLRELASVEPGEENPWATAVAASGTVAALARVDPGVRAGDPAFEVLRVRCLSTLRASFDPASGFAEDVPRSAYGLVAWAHGRAGVLDPSFTRARAEEAVRRAFRETPASGLAAQMPFLAWADLELHPEGELPSMQALSAMRAQVYEFQLHWRDLRSTDRDLAGGVVFTRSSMALPTWHTLRPIAGIATMLGDERLTPGGIASSRVSRELVVLSDALRFTRQLVMSGDGLFLARNPGHANGGVRRALWDPTLAPQAGAIALMTVCESLESMRSLTRRRPASSGPDEAVPTTVP
ncbi:MAG: hypothetical protein AAGA55_04070 [Planctomycetota bacterium]